MLVSLAFAGLFYFGAFMQISYSCELKDIADSFEKLLDIEYIYTLKSKASETGTKELHIRFLREQLYHLSGLQHFKDVEKLKLFREHKRNSKDFFYDLKLENITLADISKSKSYNLEKQKRLFYLLNLEKLLDTNKKIYTFDNIVHGKKNNYKSLVKANYILKNVENNENVFIFLNKATTETIYSAISLFCPSDDYSRGQHEECMLIKKKFLKRNSVQTVFIHPAYLKNHLELVETEKEYISKTPELQSILNSISENL